MSWPFPERPGVPLNPERDAFHWIRRRNCTWPEAWRWDPDADGCGTECSGAWAEADGDGQPEDMARWYLYLGPCLTPDEVQSHLAAAQREGAEAMRERAAKVALRLEVSEDAGPIDGHARVMASVQIAHAIRALAVEGGGDV